MRVATLNVHGWVDANRRPNRARVAEAIREHGVDVIAFQEVMGGVQALAKELGFAHARTDRGVALVSRFPIAETQGIVVDETMLPPEAKASFAKDPANRRVSLTSALLRIPRAIVATIKHPSGQDIQVVCLYLDYLTEDRRLKQLSALLSALPKKREGSTRGRLLLGDLNSLNVGDYKAEPLSEIRRVREENNWEAPRNEVTESLQRDGWRDCYAEAKKTVGPLATSRFHTRIDYIYADEDMLQLFNCSSVEHVEGDMSDHLMVIAEFKIAK